MGPRQGTESNLYPYADFPSVASAVVHDAALRSSLQAAANADAAASPNASTLPRVTSPAVTPSLAKQDSTGSKRASGGRVGSSGSKRRVSTTQSQVELNRQNSAAVRQPVAIESSSTSAEQSQLNSPHVGGDSRRGSTKLGDTSVDGMISLQACLCSS